MKTRRVVLFQARVLLKHPGDQGIEKTDKVELLSHPQPPGDRSWTSSLLDQKEEDVRTGEKRKRWEEV